MIRVFPAEDIGQWIAVSNGILYYGDSSEDAERRANEAAPAARTARVQRNLMEPADLARKLAGNLPLDKSA